MSEQPIQHCMGADAYGFSMPLQELAALIKKHSLLPFSEQGDFIFEATNQHLKPEADNAPTEPSEPMETKVTKGNFSIYLPNTRANADTAPQPPKKTAPKDELLDLWKERMEKHDGKVSEQEIEEARPTQPYEEAADYRFWEKVNAAHEAELTGSKPQPQWRPCGQLAEPPADGMVDLYREAEQRRASNAINEKCDAAEEQAHKALMEWHEKRKAQNK